MMMMIIDLIIITQIISCIFIPCIIPTSPIAGSIKTWVGWTHTDSPLDGSVSSIVLSVDAGTVVQQGLHDVHISRHGGDV